jgi:hypothetical protein
MPRALRLALPVILLAGAGCSSPPPAPHGAPVLLRVVWERPAGLSVVWSRDPNPSLVASVPGDASRVHFVFDRRLDGARIEETVDGGPVSRQPPAVTVTWPDSDQVMSSPPFAADAFYNSTPPPSPPFGAGTGDVFVRPRALGFPSATTVTFVLDKAALTSVYGEAIDAPDGIPVAIDPLAVLPSEIGRPDALITVPSGYMFPVTFSNRPAGTAALLPFAHARAGDVELPIVLSLASGAPTRIYVAPAPCLGAWPSGQIDVSFDPGLPDAFGVPTAVALLSGSFLVADGAGAGPADGGCL